MMLYALLFSLLGPEITTMDDPRPSISILLANYERPLVSSHAAAAIAKSILGDYYGPELFRPESEGTTVEDMGSYWNVTLRNVVQLDYDDPRRMPVLVMKIAKMDGRVIEIRTRSIATD